ncbi:FAD-dependent oxidoreductase [Salisediminibacterium halotolerans]|uniref:Pyridine nucleotide-disulphide oxidoreductase n=1 Tax=Salisediminibacterium halotolerans TaxID=517425 RepID=A0A1H9TTZ0_9BACI|nr:MULTISPECIES: FAD-dependent oxidoreductase [Salisediminibacterium]RLJ75555.1 pyridine nucleotide-disulfide oxidoreductase [Actinophytocola xinjiangensis]RPE89408.1 pyridine nucleotide-disulfide oxidoreductase [Salisediminibacterium halotolerans]TWG36168.1 pyridine nucleotide-disulfide oxidoreductase [Salisediminibacterium halotolerans]SES00451.1 Pyridine nucleotide-disulphide oxidoreductase [Salisediminibacterium haloalkalitolerans]GEL07644.1 hypothetical protein SHA02_10600 [Salisediminiba
MYDIIVVGAGPAGASAALIAAKAGKSTLMLDNDTSITKKAWVKNHYGVKEITGPELVETGIEQAKRFGTETARAKVDNVEAIDGGVRVSADSGVYEAAQVILATGVAPAVAEASGIAVKEGTEPKIKKIVDAGRDGRTTMPGVWAAGTCAGVSVHTIVTAGHGAEVAINVVSAMNGERYVDHDVLS